ncbi:uncharacterized protein LOC107365706 [Tetranychus urticae]|uniref:uncharacterized protein LOC107365706 n=1 Tax=Tetranychus urticae TaxID=32264 RepID=UPI00077BFB3D|nr:uncharacterized protein LOC107365706 [Tetranychus urticae]
MPMSQREVDCSLVENRNSIFCKILPLGLPFDITERGKDGKLYQIHIKTQSADTVLYISAVVAVYVLVVIVLLATQFLERGGNRQSRLSIPFKKNTFLLWDSSDGANCSLESMDDDSIVV